KGLAQLTFAKKTEKVERCLSSKMTRRISHITDNGTIIYWSECQKWGVATVDRTPAPAKVYGRYLQGLKSGMNAVYAYSNKGAGSDRAVAVVAAFPKGKKVPSVVFGVPVK